MWNRPAAESTDLLSVLGSLKGSDIFCAYLFCTLAKLLWCGFHNCTAPLLSISMYMLFQRAYVGGKDKETCAITVRFHCMVQWFFSSTKYQMKINLVCHYMLLWTISQCSPTLFQMMQLPTGVSELCPTLLKIKPMYPATNGSSVFFYSTDVRHFATWRENIFFLKKSGFGGFFLLDFAQKRNLKNHKILIPC